jgi:hypothetical protein
MNNYHLIAELCKLLAESNMGNGEPEINFDGDKLQFGVFSARVWDVGVEVWTVGKFYKSFDTVAEAALTLYQQTR